MKLTSIYFLLLTVFVLSCFAPYGATQVPIIYSSDLYHPHGDPDDHYDLATLFAQEEFDIRGIVIDVRNSTIDGVGWQPIEQMMHITGRRVPYAIGLKNKLKSRTDKAFGQPAVFQSGIDLTLSLLRKSKEKVVLFSAGSGRDFAAAFNREPELMKNKVKAVYLNAGNGPGGIQWESNTDRGKHEYLRLFESGLPIYWCPCWTPEPWAKQISGTRSHKTYATLFYLTDQNVVYRDSPLAVQNYFVYCLTRSKDDPITFLKTGPHELPRGKRHLWCIAPLIHAAGRAVYERKPGDFVALSEENAGRKGLAGKKVKAFEFVPCRVVSQYPARRTKHIKQTVTFDSKKTNVHIFHTADTRYYEILTSCLRNLLDEIEK